MWDILEPSLIIGGHLLFWNHAWGIWEPSVIILCDSCLVPVFLKSMSESAIVSVQPAEA